MSLIPNLEVGSAIICHYNHKVYINPYFLPGLNAMLNQRTNGPVNAHLRPEINLFD